MRRLTYFPAAFFRFSNFFSRFSFVTSRSVTDEPFPMASVCKTPILVDVHRKAVAGSVSLDKRIEFTEAARTPGSGLFNFFDAGLQPTLRDLTLMMIVVSDNAATDLVLQGIGGPKHDWPSHFALQVLETQTAVIRSGLEENLGTRFGRARRTPSAPARARPRRRQRG